MQETLNIEEGFRLFIENRYEELSDKYATLRFTF